MSDYDRIADLRKLAQEPKGSCNTSGLSAEQRIENMRISSLPTGRLINLLGQFCLIGRPFSCALCEFNYIEIRLNSSDTDSDD